MPHAPLSRILIVTGEPGIQSVARLVLEGVGGFTVEIYASGSAAISAAPAFGPELIVIEAVMPDMDGPATLKALRTLPQTALTPIVFMAADAQVQDLRRFKALGVLEVIPKPFDPLTLPKLLLEIWTSYQVDVVEPMEREFEALRNAFVAQLVESVAQIAEAWEALQGTWDVQTLIVLHRLAHSLAGSSATFGFPTIGEWAASLEAQALELRDGAAPPNAVRRALITDMLEALKLAARAPERRAVSDAPPAAVEQNGLALAVTRPPRFEPQDNRLIFLAEPDPRVAGDLALQIGHFGYRVQTFTRLADLKQAVAQVAPAAIITDMQFPAENAAGAEIFTAIRGVHDHPVPVLFVSDRSDLDARLQAVRSGGDAYFTKPVNVGALIDKLDMCTVQQMPEPYRILIVEDGAILSSYYALLLREAGMVTAVVNDPMQVMRPLAEFRPDLILMDVYMPGCDGMDLAAVIRQQEDYVGIPIVFLSTETNPDMQQEALRMGGDDFLTKPIPPDRLIVSVTSRVQRSRALRSLMVRDSLTGLLNHTTVKERLSAEVVRSRRARERLALAVIDIDHFKSVNDTYGHPTGDRVLKSLSRLLQQRLRKSDIIGRYGGEEFVVILIGTDGASAVGVLDEIRAHLAHIRQQAEGAEFSVTFSCGIADFPTYADATALTQAADKALYEAKRGGRNRVILAHE